MRRGSLVSVSFAIDHTGGRAAVWTLNGAYASFGEKVKGSITPGKFADLVCLDRDPLAADPQSIKDIRVTRTIVDGRTVYQA